MAAAERRLDEIARVLSALGGTLDAATPGEIIDVDAEVIAIEESIWQYNATINSARAAWLRADLSADANRRLLALRTPHRWGLPEFTDELQAQQALHQQALVDERLRRRNQSAQRVDVAMTVAQVAETSGGIALGGGATMTITKQTARWIVVKNLVEIATPQTLHGVDLAAAAIAYILRHRPGRRDPVAVFPSLASQMRQPAKPASTPTRPVIAKQPTAEKLQQRPWSPPTSPAVPGKRPNLARAIDEQRATKPSLATERPAGGGPVPRPTQRSIREAFYNQKLAEAQNHLDEIERILAALGEKLDAAKIDQDVDVDTEAVRIEELI